MTKIANGPKELALTREDVALLADGTGNIPDDTAARLQALIRCDDADEIGAFWRCSVTPWLEELSQMTEDAGVELLADGLCVFRDLERLRSLRWQQPTDVLDGRLDVPYRELIVMAGALAERAEGVERIGLERLAERLTAALGAEMLEGDNVEMLIDRLLEIGQEAADEVLGQVVARYRQRRKAVHPPAVRSRDA